MVNKYLKYPIYIVSKGRFSNGITWKYFHEENIPFKIAVEPNEYENYCNYVPEKYIFKLPFDNLNLGSFPARNACWEDSIKNGYNKHFIFDDNIHGFDELVGGRKIKIESLKPLIFLEKMSANFSKLALIGFNYDTFTRGKTNPYTFNCHVYSAIFIDNKIPFRWRLKYNEDVDLCLQVLHAKWNTILLNKYLINKVSTTSKMKGGNQTLLYQNNDFGKKMLKTKSLQMIWPQYVKIVHKFGRPHHQIEWRKHFKHPLLKYINVMSNDGLLNQGKVYDKTQDREAAKTS